MNDGTGNTAPATFIFDTIEAVEIAIDTLHASATPVSRVELHVEFAPQRTDDSGRAADGGGVGMPPIGMDNSTPDGGVRGDGKAAGANTNPDPDGDADADADADADGDSDSEYVCDECGERFDNPNALGGHMSSHNG